MFTDPKFIFWLGIGVTIEQGIAGGAVHLTNMVPDAWIPFITSWAAFFAFVGTAIMTALTGYSSNKSGPLVSTGAPRNVPVVLLALVTLAMLLALSSSATAQTPTPRPRPAQIGDLFKPKNSAATTQSGPLVIGARNGTSVSPLEKIMNDIAAVKKEIVDGVIEDLTAADADASTIDPQTGQMRDPIAHACYPAQIKFLQSLPSAQPLTGKFVAVQLHQRVRDLVLQVKAGLPTYLKLGCAPLIGDDLQVLVQTLGLVGVQVGGALLTGGGSLALPPLPLLPIP